MWLIKTVHIVTMRHWWQRRKRHGAYHHSIIRLYFYVFWSNYIFMCIFSLSVWNNLECSKYSHFSYLSCWYMTKNLFSKNTKYVMLLLQDKSWFLVLKSNHKDKKLQLLVNGFHANFLTVSHTPNMKPHSPLCCFIEREKASWKLKFERSKTWEGRKSGSQILL